MTEFALPVNVDPAEALMDEVRRSAGVVRALGQELTASGGMAAMVDQGQPSALARLWSTERSHLVKVAAAALASRAGARLVSLAEDDARRMGAVTAAALDELGVYGDQRVQALNAARERYLSLVAESE